MGGHCAPALCDGVFAEQLGGRVGVEGVLEDLNCTSRYSQDIGGVSKGSRLTFG